MDITLSLVSLHHKQIRHMASNVVLVARRIAAKHFL